MKNTDKIINHSLFNNIILVKKPQILLDVLVPVKDRIIIS